MLLKCLVTVSIFSLHAIALFGQTIDHWEGIFYYDDLYRYQTSKDSVSDPNWRTTEYDDSTWPQVQGGIGYGDDDDNTVTDTVASVFIRKEFTIIDSAEIVAAVLHVDYDDAFVAFLNGEEIARAGGLFEALPTFDALAIYDMEAQIPEGGIPSEFIIPEGILRANLRTGTNTFAIQVHNVTLISSDLSSNTWFSVGLNTETERYLPLPSWIESNDTGFSSNLPIVVIETNGGITIPDDPKISAHMGIVYNGPGERNHSTDPYTEYNGNIGIETRGNSTSNYPKKPYSFETRESTGENRNISLLGMPAENDWILRASYFDHTFIRNPLANYMARQTGYWASRTRHVELILNGEYQGIYLLMEKLKRDDNRLDIARLDSSDIAGVDLSGGYIWEITGFDDHFGESRKLKYPNIADVMPEQLTFIQATDDAFRNKMRSGSDTYSNPNTGYVEHIWTESFIYEALVQEAMRNSDAYGWSGYYHKGKNELIHAGPVWDFDQSSGNSSYPDNGVVDGWLIEHNSTSNTPFYWPLLLNDAFFQYSLSLRWKELRAEKFSTENLLTYVDSIALELSEAQVREFEKWPVLGQYIWRETNGYQQRDSYQKEVDYLKNFLTERWNWIDDQLANIPEPSGYPEISTPIQIPDMMQQINQETENIDLNNFFSFPYAPAMKYVVASSDTSIIKTKVNKTGTLRVKLKRIGTSTITVTATDTYGNKLHTNFNFEVVSSLESIAENNRYEFLPFTLYPNPASSYTLIQVPHRSNSEITIEVYSYTGLLIERVYQGASQQLINYDCSMLKNGVYIIRIHLDQNQYTQKLIIQK